MDPNISNWISCTVVLLSISCITTFPFMHNLSSQSSQLSSPPVPKAPPRRSMFPDLRSRKKDKARRLSVGPSNTQQQLKINEAWTAADSKPDTLERLEIRWARHDGWVGFLSRCQPAIDEWQSLLPRTLNVTTTRVFRGLWWGRRATCSCQEDSCLVFAKVLH